MAKHFPIAKWLLLEALIATLAIGPAVRATTLQVNPAAHLPAGLAPPNPDRVIDHAKMNDRVRLVYLEASKLWRNNLNNIGWGEIARLVSMTAKVGPGDLLDAKGNPSAQNVYGHTRAIETAFLLMARVAQKEVGGDPLAPQSIQALSSGLAQHLKNLASNDALAPAYASLFHLTDGLSKNGVSAANANKTQITGKALKQFMDNLLQLAKERAGDQGNQGAQLLEILKDPEIVRRVLDTTPFKLADGTPTMLGDALGEQFGLTSAQLAGALAHGLSAAQGIHMLAAQWPNLSDSQKIVGICQVAAHGILAAQAAMAVTSMGTKAALLLLFLMMCDFLDLGIDLGFPGDGSNDGDDNNDDGDPEPQGGLAAPPPPATPKDPANPGPGQQCGLSVIQEQTDQKIVSGQKSNDQAVRQSAQALQGRIQTTNEEITTNIGSATESGFVITPEKAQSLSAARAQQSSDVRKLPSSQSAPARNGN